MKIRKSVGAFVANKNGKFLLVRTHGRGDVYWDITKGGIEKGETSLSALKRELKEELGTDKFGKIKKLNLSFTFEFPEKVKKDGIDFQRVELFYVEFLGNDEDIRVDKKEISEAIFVDKNEFIKKVSFETTRNTFKKFINSF